jgi:hypothetical protein
MKGEISPETFEEWNRETGGRHLPERVTRVKKTARKKSRKTRKANTAGKAKRARRR